MPRIQQGMSTTSRYIRNVSSDKGGLHMKMVADTSETIKYARQLKDVGPKVMNKYLQQWMREVMAQTKAHLHSYSDRQFASERKQWERKDSSFWSNESEVATKKIARSLRVAETRDSATEQNGISVSMWSQDQERPDNFTSAGVRGSRARTGRSYEGKIAQYYEQGRAPFTIHRDASYGTQSFTHAGYPRIAYMQKAREKVINKWLSNIDRVLEQNIGVGKSADVKISPTANRGY